MDKLLDLPDVETAFHQLMAGGDFFATSNRPPPDFLIAGRTNEFLEGKREEHGRKPIFNRLLQQDKYSLGVKKEIHSTIWEPILYNF